MPPCRQALCACLIPCRSNESLKPWNPWKPWSLGLLLIGAEGSEERFCCVSRVTLFALFFDAFSKSDFEHPLALILSKMSPKWTPRRSKMESFGHKVLKPKSDAQASNMLAQNPTFSSFLQLRF